MGGAFFNPLSRVGNQPKFLSAGKYKPRFQKTFDILAHLSTFCNNFFVPVLVRFSEPLTRGMGGVFTPPQRPTDCFGLYNILYDGQSQR